MIQIEHKSQDDNSTKQQIQNQNIKQDIRSSDISFQSLGLSKFHLFIIFITAIVLFYNLYLIRNCAMFATKFCTSTLAHLINYLTIQFTTTVSLKILQILTCIVVN